MIDQPNKTDNGPVLRVDSSAIKDDQHLFQGNVYDAENNLIGPAPMKEHATNKEFMDSFRTTAKMRDRNLLKS